MLLQLIDYDVDPNDPEKTGQTMLHLLAEAETDEDLLIDLATMLLDHGADVNLEVTNTQVTPLVVATQLGKQKLAELFLERGANPL